MVKKSRGSRIEFYTYTIDENKRTAKSRLPLPREMKDLTFPQIWDMFKETLNK